MGRSEQAPLGRYPMFSKNSRPVCFILSLGVIAGWALTGFAHAQSPVPPCVRCGATRPLDTTSADKSVLITDAVLNVSGVDPAFFKTDSVDVTPYKTVRVVVMLTQCFSCSPGKVRVESPDVIDTFTVSTEPPGAGSRVYEVPGESLEIAIANSNPGTSTWSVRIYGRRN